MKKLKCLNPRRVTLEIPESFSMGRSEVKEILNGEARIYAYLSGQKVALVGGSDPQRLQKVPLKFIKGL